MGLVILSILLGGVSSVGKTLREPVALRMQNEGTLSGYVNNSLMQPLEGALVRVSFHGTYEEDYTDETGYYHVTNIPICWCMKNCSASKEGYESEWVLLAIGENSMYDFVLEPSIPFEGTLSGYVNNTLMQPLEGALVQVHFHGTYEEDYTDETGYYHVMDIPICYCLKNATASKEGYYPDWVLLGITENTTHDFVLTSINPLEDLDCEGGLEWVDIPPGEIVTGSFQVENIGEAESMLDWEIISWPDWGTWSFDPESGSDLTPEDGQITIDVEVVAPDEPLSEYGGVILIKNINNPPDTCCIDLYLVTTETQELHLLLSKLLYPSSMFYL